jgi:hypothetical protein
MHGASGASDKALPVRGKNKKKKGKDHKGASRGRGRTARDVNDIIDANALAFVNAKRDPWNAGEGVVFPSADPFPVTPQHLHGRFTPAVHGLTTGSYWAFRVKPDVAAFVTQSVPGAATPGDITCYGGIGVNAVGYAGILSNFGFYRTVGLGLRIVGLQQLLEAGGSLVVSRLPPATSAAIDLTEIWESALTDVVSAGALSEEVDGEFIRWIACSDQSGIASAGSTPYITASGFRSPAYNSVDSEIWICMYCEASSTDLSVEVEYDFLINSIPLATTNQLFDVTAVPSSPDALAKADLAASMADSDGSGSKRAGSGLIGLAKHLGHEALGYARSGLSDLTKELGPFGQIAGDVGGAAIDFLGGLFAVPPEYHGHLVHKHAEHYGENFLQENLAVLGPRRLVAMHQLAVASGLFRFSPLASPLPPHVVTIGEFIKFLALHTADIDRQLVEPDYCLKRSQRRRRTSLDVEIVDVPAPPNSARAAR